MLGFLLQGIKYLWCAVAHVLSLMPWPKPASMRDGFLGIIPTDNTAPIDGVYMEYGAN